MGSKNIRLLNTTPSCPYKEGDITWADPIMTTVPVPLNTKVSTGYIFVNVRVSIYKSSYSIMVLGESAMHKLIASCMEWK